MSADPVSSGSAAGLKSSVAPAAACRAQMPSISRQAAPGVTANRQSRRLRAQKSRSLPKGAVTSSHNVTSVMSAPSPGANQRFSFTPAKEAGRSLGTTPMQVPASSTKAQLKSRPAWRRGAPTMTVTPVAALRSARCRRARSLRSSRTPCRKRSAHVEAVRLNSGQSSKEQPASAARSMARPICSPLKATSPTRSSGIATPTRTKPYLESKKDIESSPQRGIPIFRFQIFKGNAFSVTLFKKAFCFWRKKWVVYTETFPDGTL